MKMFVLVSIAWLVFISGVIAFIIVTTVPHYNPDNGAPNGVYLQKDWGISNSNTSWSFARCEHDYLGPLHGTWVKLENVTVPDWHNYPGNSLLFIELKDNEIVKAWVEKGGD